MDITVDLESGGRLILRGADDDGALTNADVELVDPEGRRWPATVMTQAEVARIMDMWRSSGECQNGAYFRVPDLIIVREAAQESVAQLFSELCRLGEHRVEMTLLSDAQPTAI